MPDMDTNSATQSDATLHSTASFLLIDDDVSFIQVLSRILQRYSDQRFATSCPEGLKLVQERAPDLILLDIEMPDHDGFDFCKMLKSDPAFADIPVIFITSHAKVPIAIAGFKLGAADFITKPVNQTALLARVSEQIEMKRAADKRQARLNELLTGVRDNEE